MQMIKNKNVVLFCALFLLCAFGMFSKEPSWITMPSKEYPSSEYLTGLGYGQTEEQAEISAIESLASVFGQNITSSSTATRRMAQVQGNVKTFTGSDAQFSQEIQRKVSIENLIGVRIAERYFDGKRHHALAVMNKREASTMLGSTIINNNARIESLLKYDSDDEFSFSTYAQLDLARETAVVNDTLLKRLDVVDSQKAAELRPQCKSAASIKKRMAEIAKQIPIYIEIEGDSSGKQVKQAFAKMVSSSGFKTSDLANERYCITGTVSFSKREPKSGQTVQCVYTFDGRLRDTLLEENLLPISIQGREGSIDMDDAMLRAYRALEAKINTTVAPAFTNFLNSL